MIFDYANVQLEFQIILSFQLIFLFDNEVFYFSTLVDSFYLLKIYLMVNIYNNYQ